MGISTAAADPRAEHVEISEDELTVTLTDGRRVSVPLAWFPRLLDATPRQRANWSFIGDGDGIHWPDIDEDLSVAGLLLGVPAPGGSQGDDAS